MKTTVTGNGLELTITATALEGVWKASNGMVLTTADNVTFIGGGNTVYTIKN